MQNTVMQKGLDILQKESKRKDTPLSFIHKFSGNKNTKRVQRKRRRESVKLLVLPVVIHWINSYVFHQQILIQYLLGAWLLEKDLQWCKNTETSTISSFIAYISCKLWYFFPTKYHRKWYLLHFSRKMGLKLFSLNYMCWSS